MDEQDRAQAHRAIDEIRALLLRMLETHDDRGMGELIGEAMSQAIQASVLLRSDNDEAA